jgi:hypothetical protein
MRKKSWGIWVLSQKSWMENNNRKPARYTKRVEAKQDCDTFNSMHKGKKVYEVREMK